MAFANPDDAGLKAILGRSLTIAVATCSTAPQRDSYRIAGRLQGFGFRMIPVNPMASGTQIHGERCYASLIDIPEPVDMVNIFSALRHGSADCERCHCQRCAYCLDATRRDQYGGSTTSVRGGPDGGDGSLYVA